MDKKERKKITIKHVTDSDIPNDDRQGTAPNPDCEGVPNATREHPAPSPDRAEVPNATREHPAPSPDHEEVPEPASTHPDREEGDDIAALEDRLNELLDENDKLIENLQRERASFINYRQRVEEEKAQIRRYSSQDLAFDLLNVLDYFEASMNFDNTSSDIHSIIQGVKFTIEELRRILAKYGIKEIECDSPFDPKIHEAFGVEFTDKAEPGTILQVHRKGYMYKDRVLRPAMVTVARTPDTPNDTREHPAPNSDR